MATTQAGKFRPWTLIWTFIGLVVLLYGLVFLTPGQNTPKLGIDLQGGTRVTLQARTLDGSTPSRESMTQARTIMETRVNGSGVVGAQVQLDGASQLVVTVPGQKDLGALTRAARLNIRAVEGEIPLAAGIDPSASASVPSGSSGSSSAPTTEPAIGETLAPSSSAQVGEAPGASSGSAAPTSGSAAPSSAAPSSGAGSSAAPLRGREQAVTTASSAPDSAAATDTGRMTTQGAAPSSGSDGSAGSSAAATDTSAPSTLDSGSTGASGTAAPSSGAGSGPQWPAGSNPELPIQPSGTDAAAFTAWISAAQQSLASGTITCADINRYQGLDDPDKPVLACDTAGQLGYVLDKTLIPGDQISGATAGTSSGGWVINVTFNSTGFNTWASYTAQNVGKQTAFTLDGQVLSAPSIRQAINTVTTEVSGSFTQQSATELANALKFGALPLQFTADKTDEVSAEVGAESLQAGLIAGGIGLLLVVLYCLFYYRLLGVITILSLVLSGILVYAVMVLLGRWMDLSLDMAGVAGLIIAIGITADSFVVYFERLKDEVREGRTFRSAVPRGWERAKRTILSADAVTFLSAVILYILAVGEVKGFAFTLGLSTVLDLVVVFLVTHPLVALAAGNKVFTSPRYSGLGAVAAAGARHRAATSRLTPKEA